MKTKSKLIGIKAINDPSTLDKTQLYTPYEVQNMIRDVAAQQDLPRECWIYGENISLSYCYECGTKRLEELLKEKPDGRYRLDWAYDAESDDFARCEDCDIPLSNCITSECAEEYLEGSIEHGLDFAEPYDCYCMSLALDCLDDDVQVEFI